MRSYLVLAAGWVAACAGSPTAPRSAESAKSSLEFTEPVEASDEGASLRCGGGPLTVHFYDAGQALAALVELPGGKTILVDTGESATRPACGQPCKDWSARVLAGLKKDVGSRTIDLLWITHQHSDHLGNVPAVFDAFTVGLYVDNGTDLTKPMVLAARAAASEKNVPVSVIDPDHTELPFDPPSGVKLTPVVPETWKCSANPNNCSIGLRIDYCSSSILFVGDAEDEEEAEFDTRGEVTLLQVGHHGSDTSSSEEFITRTKPRYAVISSGKVGEGTNKSYCHPRLSTVERLVESVDAPGVASIRSFDGAVKCSASTPANWVDASGSSHVWATLRDGTVVLTTTGDGVFVEASPNAKPRADCCKVCSAGKACGDTCLASTAHCSSPVGCACNGR